MKILWVKTDFLHPTTRGGQIRTLETLRRLHRSHEVHYVAFGDPGSPEGLERSSEYSSAAYPVLQGIPDKRSLAFVGQLAAGLFSPLPVSVSRFRSAAMRRTIAALLARHRFDTLICDFLFPAANLPNPDAWILFQHNVEAVIWQRRASHTPDALRRAYLQLQARRMLAYEGEICRRVRKVIAVSEADAEIMRSRYQARDVVVLPTGVDLEYFTPCSEAAASSSDLIFLGSMDWMPNVDGAVWFVREVLPLIHRRRPDATVALVGRTPDPRLLELARSHPQVRVTGTVPDVRPYLFGASVLIVPLRIGGGTRLKIYEAMAARVPVVSTTIGAEGLDVVPGQTLLLADSPQEFAQACIHLLDHPSERTRLAEAAWRAVSSRYSWDAVAQTFESHLSA